jgi:hypothetical protein
MKKIIVIIFCSIVMISTVAAEEREDINGDRLIKDLLTEQYFRYDPSRNIRSKEYVVGQDEPKPTARYMLKTGERFELINDTKTNELFVYDKEKQSSNKLLYKTKKYFYDLSPSGNVVYLNRADDKFYYYNSYQKIYSRVNTPPDYWYDHPQFLNEDTIVYRVLDNANQDPGPALLYASFVKEDSYRQLTSLGAAILGFYKNYVIYSHVLFTNDNKKYGVYLIDPQNPSVYKLSNNSPYSSGDFTISNNMVSIYDSKTNSKDLIDLTKLSSK